ncbi:MAG: Amuc_1099 family pilus-like system protein [Verrucomicrobiota bacterium]
MEAIKTKYDRILLGLFALVAIVIGAYTLLKALSFKDQFPPPAKAGKEMADLGPVKSEDVAKATTALNTKNERTPFKIGEKTVDLMVSTPVIKTIDGNTIALLDPAATQLRPPIDNAWLYSNELPLTRDDVASMDEDGDGYSNLEEFEGKSNPRNRSDVPPFYTKLKYVECVKEPLSLKFGVFNGGEIQLTRIQGNVKRGAFFKAGEVFPVDNRFKALKVETRQITKGGITTATPVLILQDTEAKDGKNIEIVLGETVDLPKLSAKIVDDLSKKEFVLREGQEFEVPKLPGLKVLVTKVAEESVTLSFISPGKSARQEETLKLQ